MRTSKKAAIGAGVGLAALAAIGAYFLAGKKNAGNRERVCGWMLKMKGEVLEKAEELKKLDKETYHRIVDEAAARYAKLEKVGSEELKKLTAEMKSAWGKAVKRPE